MHLIATVAMIGVGLSFALLGYALYDARRVRREFEGDELASHNVIRLMRGRP